MADFFNSFETLKKDIKLVGEMYGESDKFKPLEFLT